MFDFTGVFLIAIILILTIFLLILGLQVFFVLKDLRITLGKFNKVLEDAGDITSTIKEPANTISSFLSGLKSGMSILDLFKRRK